MPIYTTTIWLRLWADLLHVPDEIISKLKRLYQNFEPTANQDGTPRTTTFCVRGKGPDELRVSVTTSKNDWMSGSFLQKWVTKTRAARFGKKGRKPCKIIVNEVDQVVNFSSNGKVEVIKLMTNEYVARNLRQLEAQAFNRKTLWQSRPMLAMPYHFWLYVDVKAGGSSNSNRTRRNRCWGEVAELALQYLTI